MITRILLILTSLLNILFTMSICLFITQPSFLNLIIDQDCPEDEDKCLLLSLSTFIGSLGYSNSVLYTSISPLWDDILISITVFSLLMMVSNFAMFVYSTFYFSTKYYPYIAWPWLMFSCPTMLLLFSTLVFLMMDLNNNTRVIIEMQSGGNGMLAKTLSTMLVITLYKVLSILVVVFHLVRDANHPSPKVPVRMLGRFYNVRPLPHAASTPARERRITSGRNVAGPVQVEINEDSREFEFCGPEFTPSVASFPGVGGVMVSQMESIEKKWKTSEELKCRAADNGMDMAGTLEMVEHASVVDEEMEESAYLVGLKGTVVLELFERPDVIEEVECTKIGDGSELSNDFDGWQKIDSSSRVEKENRERQSQIRMASDGLERKNDLTSLSAPLVGLERMTSRVELDKNEGQVFHYISESIEEEPLRNQDSRVDIFEEDSYKKQVDNPPDNTENILCDMECPYSEEDITKHDESSANRSVGMLSMPADTLILLPDNVPDVSIGSGFD